VNPDYLTDDPDEYCYECTMDVKNLHEEETRKLKAALLRIATGNTGSTPVSGTPTSATTNPGTRIRLLEAENNELKARLGRAEEQLTYSHGNSSRVIRTKRPTSVS